MWKAMWTGAIVALLLVAVVGAGGFLYLRTQAKTANLAQGDRVVLIFESPAEDGATVAALISMVADGRMQDISPDTSTTVPGTTYNRLSDAYVFGGGAAVARSVTSTSTSRTAFVSVPAATWRTALEATQGVTVNVPQKVTVFDGTSLITIAEGQRTLSAAEVSALLRGLSYVSPEGAAALRLQIERQLAAALVAAPPVPDAVQSDLAPEPLAIWMRDYLAKAASAQGQ